MKLLSAADALPDSPARLRVPTRPPLRIGAVQHRWHPDPAAHRKALSEGVRMAAGEGATVICLQELTLSPYFAVTPGGPSKAGVKPEPLPGGPTYEFAAALAAETGAFIHASLYEAPGDGDGDGLGFNTAICVAPDGALLARTRKLHIPRGPGYHEDEYFRSGTTGYPAISLAGATFGFPTCWDQWFPELARAYSLAGAEVLVYPTAIGSEPELPDFDTEPLWQQVIVANGIANGTFMVAVNRIGHEPPVTFYGSSFISDPYGRVVLQAPRDEPAVLVADLDLDQRRDWLSVFNFFETRRPDTYGPLLSDERPAPG
jgi:N-carbamoylputrescine amidase